MVCERQDDDLLARRDEYHEEGEALHRQPLDATLAQPA
jgi:hypothetical protein